VCAGIIRYEVVWSQGEGGGAVSRVLFRHQRRLDGHLSGMAVTRHLWRPTRGSSGPGQASPPIWPCSDWGLPCHACYQVVRWALTPPFHPYLPPGQAVCFLWPLPSPYSAQVLPGSLPCGARTFLDPRKSSRDRHAPPPSPKHSVQVGHKEGARLLMNWRSVLTKS